MSTPFSWAIFPSAHAGGGEERTEGLSGELLDYKGMGKIREDQGWRIPSRMSRRGAEVLETAEAPQSRRGARRLEHARWLYSLDPRERSRGDGLRLTWRNRADLGSRYPLTTPLDVANKQTRRVTARHYCSYRGVKESLGRTQIVGIEGRFILHQLEPFYLRAYPRRVSRPSYVHVPWNHLPLRIVGAGF